MSQFVVSARKYRPQNFDEVVGQNHISQTLKKALESNKLAHAFLFCGPRGVGKTTCARILAKVINCQNPPNPYTACENCDSCKGFQKNASFNIFELDAASHNSVEHIRTLNEQVRFQPQQGTHKVFIIDEVHMLSAQAFNAFLKTLEEPPAHAVFILATTEKHKILPTILSRCQIFDFKRIQISEIVAQLKYISEKEKIQAEEEALHVIASKADGAMRDALSMFDRIVSSTGDNSLKYQDVISNLNILDYEVYFKAVDACIQEDLTALFVLFNDVLKRGFEPNQFALGTAEHLRNLLFSKDPETLELLETTEDLKKKYAQQTFLCTKRFLINGLSILNDADVHYQRAVDKRLHIEIALTRLCYIHRAFEASIPDSEKKSLVAKKVKKSGSDPKKSPGKLAVQQIKEEVEPVEIIPPNQTKAPEVVELAKVENKKEPAESLIQNTPSVNQIDHLINKAKQKIDSSKLVDIPFTVENVQEIWDKYIETLDSPSVKSILSKSLLETQEKNLKVKVGSQVAKEMLLQESDLFQKIRDQLHIPDMELQIELSPDLFPNQEQHVPKKYLSSKEKYDLMVETNPKINQLVKAFDLTLEND